MYASLTASCRDASLTGCNGGALLLLPSAASLTGCQKMSKTPTVQYAQFQPLVILLYISNLKSQIVTSSWGGTRKLPYEFTELGATMSSSVLSFPMPRRYILDENNKKLQGVIIGTTGAHANVFDGDVDTFFEAYTNYSWVGLDLGVPKVSHQLSQLPLFPNNIYQFLCSNISSYPFYIKRVDSIVIL